MFTWQMLTLPLYLLMALARRWELLFGSRRFMYNTMMSVTSCRPFRILANPFTGCVLDHFDPCKVASAVCAQSHGRSSKWFSLGHPGHSDRAGPDLVISTAVAVTLLISGLIYFRRMEKTFADTI